MASFDDRKKGFESKFAHDAEMQFKAEARRNRLLGMWAAEKMGVSDEAGKKAYAQEVIRADFQEKGDEDVFRKVASDFKAKGVNVPESEIREQMSRLMAEAKVQLMDETS